MGKIEKGKVASVDGATALVVPGSTVMVSCVVVVPAALRGTLAKDDEVVFALFEDRTGLILGRANGE